MNDYLDVAAACMLAALEVQDPAERRTLLHIAQAYLRRSEQNGESDQDATDKLWAGAEARKRQTEARAKVEPSVTRIRSIIIVSGIIIRPARKPTSR
jgi:hypothetical protein